MKPYCVIAAGLCAAVAACAQSAPDELIQLIRANDLAGLKARLASGASADSKDGRDTTLLMYASGYGTTEAVKLLLDGGASVNARNQLGNTPLLYAARNLEKARLLVEHGADVNAKTKTGRTALIVAAGCEGCGPIVKLLLDKGADPKGTDDRKMTPLLNAAASGDDEITRLLLDAGADPKAADVAGDDPLQFAAGECHLASLKAMLAKGANPNSANTASGEVKFGKVQLIGLTPLMLGSTFCGPDVVKVLLDAGAKPNAVDIRGMTPLMFAVSSEEQNTAVVKLLLKAGADVNVKSKTGETALDWASKFANRTVIAALTEAGAKTGVPYTAPVPKGVPARSTLQAVEAATAILQTSATEFFKQSGCVGCHHQPAALSAVSAARAAGAKVSEEQAKGYMKMMEGMSMNFQQALVERQNVGGVTDPWVHMLTAMAGERYQPSPLTDLVATYVAAFQRADGSWNFGGISRAPMEEGRVARTALAIRALQHFSTPGLKPEFDGRIARARDFLLKAKARTNDEAAMQIAGLHWAGVSEDKVGALAKSLAAAQRADGGWAQNPNLSSDAYATGEALWALRESGALLPADAAYQKGVKFLLGTQFADGSWYVRSRAPKFQPYFQSGFPFDHDQWISATATSWAVRALAPAVEKEKRASR